MKPSRTEKRHSPRSGPKTATNKRRDSQKNGASIVLGLVYGSLRISQSEIRSESHRANFCEPVIAAILSSNSILFQVE